MKHRVIKLRNFFYRYNTQLPAYQVDDTARWRIQWWWCLPRRRCCRGDEFSGNDDDIYRDDGRDYADLLHPVQVLR